MRMTRKTDLPAALGNQRSHSGSHFIGNRYHGLSGVLECGLIFGYLLVLD